MLYPRLKACVEEEVGIPVFGYLPLMSECALESRHLGLITAAEVGDLREKLRRLAEQAEKTLDIDGLLALSRRCAGSHVYAGKTGENRGDSSSGGFGQR